MSFWQVPHQGPGRYIQVPWYCVQPQFYPNYPVDPNQQQWIPATPYGNAPVLNGRQSESDGNDGETNVDDERSGGGSGGAAAYPPPGVALPATSSAAAMQQQPMYQMMPPFSSVYVGGIPPGVSVQGFVNSPIPYPQPYPGLPTSGADPNTPLNNIRGSRGSSGGGGGGKSSSNKISNDKGVGGAGSTPCTGSGSGTDTSSYNSISPQDTNTIVSTDPSTGGMVPAMSVANAPHPATNFVPLGTLPYSYPYFPPSGPHHPPPPPPHMPSAHHAAGSPLYMPHPSMTMYHAAPIYNSAPAAVFSNDNSMPHTAVSTAPVMQPTTTEIQSSNDTTDGGANEATYKTSTLMADSAPFEPANALAVKQKNGESENYEEPTEPAKPSPSTATESTNTDERENEDITASSASNHPESPKATSSPEKKDAQIDDVCYMVKEMNVTENGLKTTDEEDDKEPTTVTAATITMDEGRNGCETETCLTSEMGSSNESKSASPESVTCKDGGGSVASDSANSSGFESGISKLSSEGGKEDAIMADEGAQPQGAATTRTWASLFKGSSSLSTSSVSSTLAANATASATASATMATTAVKSKPLQNALAPRPSLDANNANVSSTYQSHSGSVESHTISSTFSGSTSSMNGVGAKPPRQSYSKYQTISTSNLSDDTMLPKIGELLKNYKLDHRAVNFEPRGLENRSNCCYVNAILQALLACPPFYNLMKCISTNLHNSKSAKLTNKQHFPIIDSMVQFVDEFKLISQKARRDKVRKADTTQHIEITPGKPFEPISIYNMLSVIQNTSNFVMGQQEDAQEFLTCLLNGLNDEMVELIQLSEGNTSNGVNSRKPPQPVKSPPPPPPPTTTTATKNDKKLSNGDIASEMSAPDDSDSEWKQVHPKIKHRTNNLALTRTPLSEIFRGQMRSCVKKSGDSTTNNIEPFFTLHLNIEKANSVKEALELLVGRDALEGVTSSRTNQEVDAWQQQTLEELPYVLLLHLKYFDYKHHTCTKIMKLIEFPIDLKLEPKLISTQSASKMKQTSMKSRQYKLFAVVYHDGKEASKGHYITDVFHIGYGGWIRYDDSRVTTVSENDVLKPKLPRVPYLLYYRRCDTIAALMQPPFERKQWW